MLVDKFMQKITKEEFIMQRQCAWCLRLMDSIGKPISSMPVPKIYNASHGMCMICGNLWLEQALQDTQPQTVTRPLVMEAKVSSHY
jgi:hypothetical protein